MLLSLKSKLLVTISAIVLLTGLASPGIFIQKYSTALHQVMMGQSEHLAHAIALEAAELILINDLVGLQRMLDQQRRIHPALAYLFILKDGQVLSHTFDQGIPAGLLEANQPSLFEPGFREVVSQQGDRYLDTALPISEGKAGILRLGFSESHYRAKLVKLWGEIALITLGILALALLAGLLFIRRITRPLAALVAATQEIERGEPDVRVKVKGQDEITTLAASFNQMVARQEEYTRRLEEQTLELERAYGQARTSYQIVQEVGALYTLEEMGAFLLRKLRDNLPCPHFLLLVLNGAQDTLFVFSGENDFSIFRDSQVVQPIRNTLGGATAIHFPREPSLKLPVMGPDFSAAEHQTIIPFTDNHIRGAAVIACPEGFNYNSEQIQWVGLVLKQNAGALGRAILREEEVGRLKNRVEAQAGFGEIIGKDPKMQAVYKLIEDVASSDATVLIGGESGTGKELVAWAIHRLSPRRGNPFVEINCSAYPATLLESELFGHEKGAFTGATRQKPGRFEQANGGTVFLDEIGEIPPSAQIKLLRVLQTRKFERLGGEITLNVDVRILAATNKDLMQEVEKGNFREDLFYRLNVIPIILPPLRDRRNDIPLLARHFLHRFAGQQGKVLQGISSEAMRLLLEYSWQGNVRELENYIEHAAVLAKSDQVEVWDLPSALRLEEGAPATIAEREFQHVMQVLEECSWNKKLAARKLGISRNTLYAILRRHNVDPSRPVTH